MEVLLHDEDVLTTGARRRPEGFDAVPVPRGRQRPVRAARERAPRWAKRALAQVYKAADHAHAEHAARVSEQVYGATFPRTTAKTAREPDTLLAFYGCPSERWVHLRTTHLIVSTLATIRLRTRATKGTGSRAAGLAMAFKLIEAVQTRWRAVHAPHLVTLVRSGAHVHHGQLVERHPQGTTTRAAWNIDLVISYGPTVLRREEAALAR